MVPLILANPHIDDLGKFEVTLSSLQVLKLGLVVLKTNATCPDRLCPVWYVEPTMPMANPRDVCSVPPLHVDAGLTQLLGGSGGLSR